MGDLAKLTIWDDPSIGSALSWYLDVAENRRPAKFRIAATVATQLDLTASCEDALWGRTRPPHANFSRALAGDPGGCGVAAGGGGAEPVRAMPRTCLPDARPLQFLSVELPRRPGGRRQVWGL